MDGAQQCVIVPLALTARHLQAFARALDSSDAPGDDGGPVSPQSPRSDAGWDGGVEKLTATSDFAVSLDVQEEVLL